MLIAAWSDFLGAVPMVQPKRLGPGFGVSVSNLRPGFADLRGWNAASTVVTTGGVSTLISAYRMGRTLVSDTQYWLQWTTDVDVVRSLIENDTTEEIYYTGDGAPKRTDNTLALPGGPAPAAFRSLGIPAPTAAMTAVELVAGTGSNVTRVYVDTFVNNQGRESAPGVPRTIVIKSDSTATLSGFDPLPGGYPDVTLRRIYCSTDGSDFQRVAEIAVATVSTTDNLARGAVLQSGGDDDKPAWLMPPTGLKGLIGLWNGMIGGFYGKTYCVCEPYKPWAWPVEYQEPVFDDIVGTGRWLQNWLILTTATPVLVTGSSPLSLNEQPLPFNWACRSKRSIANLGHGVAWASQNGAAYMGINGPRMLTEGILSPEQWQAMNPDTMIGTRIERYYAIFYNDGSAKGLLIDPLSPSGVIYLTQGARGVFYDDLSDRLYLLDTGNTIKRWGGGSAAAVDFKTGIKRHPYPTNPACGLVVADSPVSVQVTLWADGTQVYNATVTSGEVFPLPGGYMAQDFQARMVTTGPVQALLIGEDFQDLIL